MRIRLFIPFILFIGATSSASGQVASSKQKILNAYVEYANQSADEVTSVVKSIIDYYPQTERKNSAPRYVCPFQLDDYYATNALSQAPALGSSISGPLNKALEDLRTAEKKIDQKCKALDTYHKLEDYKQDNFANARSLINELQELVLDYKKQQSNFQLAVTSAYKKLGGSTPANLYSQADGKMLTIINTERNFIDAWMYNLKADVHTEWSVEKLQQSITDTDQQLNTLKNNKILLAYPASSMWTQFQSSLTSVLDVKRRGLDEYNFEAKKSDRHSNEVYLELINYFNGTLISDYNTFVQFAERDGYHGLKTMIFVPAFEIRSEAKEVQVEVKPFKEIQRTPLKLTTEKNAISKPVFEALSNYVEFINETWRQTRYLQSALSSFNSSATYFKTLESFDKRAPMHFDYKDYQLPLSYYQKTIASSNALLPAYAKAINDQTEVLLNILKEMDDLSASLEIEVRERKYEQDHLKKVYTILERQDELFKIWDDKKEILYGDIRAIFSNYPPSNTSSSWQVSGKVLRELTDLDRDALFKAKVFYHGDSTITIATEKIDLTLRDVIAREYENMKGIQKIGRNNGLCPYTPYEDLPETSKQLSEHFKKLKPAKTASGYNHPYHSMVYLYNDIADDYNKFCELSTSIYHLKTVKQPELFSVKYPASSKTPEIVSPQQTNRPTENKENQVTNSSNNIKSNDPVLPNNKTTFIRDTIYIEKRDTVYLTEPSETLRSMDGYAINNMILLLDVSGSMNQPEKLPLLKKSMLDMLSMMRTEDKISIIAFSGKPKILLKSSSFKEEEKIKKSVSDLSSSGKTDGNAGLKLAYKVADENYIRGGNNRIILATDGEFALSDEIYQLIETFSKEDIFLSVFNFGKGMGASKNLEKLAAAGKGNYASISKENVELKLIREAKAKRKK